MSSSDVDNPWEIAANDRLWNAEDQQEETTVTVRPSRGDHHDAPSRLLPALHALDVVMGIALASYDVVLLVRWKKEDQLSSQQDGLAMALGLLAGLLVTRAILSKGVTMPRCGMWFSKSLSLVLAIVYALLSLVGFGVYYFNDSATILPLLDWSSDHPKALPSILLGCSIMEWVRWMWIQRQYQQQMYERIMEDQETSLSRRHMWWSPRGRGRGPTTTSSNEEPLLPGHRPHWTSDSSTGYHMDEGVSHNRKWWPFRSTPTPTNARDDGSVDYASLNEEWASRSEEDPFWWTKDDNANANAAHQRD